MPLFRSLSRCTAALFLTAVCAAPAIAAPSHPLDPLSTAELAVLKKVIQNSKKFTPNAIFSWVQLKEPSKRAVLDFRYGQPFGRAADVIAIEPKKKSSFEAVVDLRAKKLISFKKLKSLQPFLSFSEFDKANAAIDADPRIKKALVKRGYVIPGKVSDTIYLDPYAPGEDEWLEKHPMRAMRILFADKSGGTNIYGPYLEGMMAIVNLDTGKVAHFVNENAPGNPHIKAPHDVFSPQIRGRQRQGLKPMTISMPKGASYTLQGNHVKWQGWDFRYSFNLREGLVLHQLGFRDKGKLRPILYRAAISEMLVPYSDPSTTWLWREFFDEGEYGLGLNSTDVRAGKELPNNAQTIGAMLPDEELAPSDYPNRIFIYERDGGPFVFHKQWTDGTRVYARGRELVIGFVATLGNYDYFYNWVLKQDGSFQFATDLEGLVLNKTVKGIQCEVCRDQSAGGPGETYEGSGDEKFGTLMDDHILAVNHQHWINLRLDFDVDGPTNAVKECNTKPLPYDRVYNPLGRAFTVTHSIFATEKDAERNANMETNRCWVVYNPAMKSKLGHPTGYLIEPVTNTTTSIPRNRFGEEVGFTGKHFWTTVNKPNEMYAAGRFPNQAPPGYKDTLPNYAGKESVYKKDLVVWYSLGYTHITKPEDYPIMPSGHVEVDFKPKGFFTRSPALDLLTLEKGE